VLFTRACSFADQRPVLTSPSETSQDPPLLMLHGGNMRSWGQHSGNRSSCKNNVSFPTRQKAELKIVRHSKRRAPRSIPRAHSAFEDLMIH